MGSRSFGDFGGRYIPETLVEAHRDLEEKYAEALADPAFMEEVAFYRKEFIGGPTPLYFAKRLTEKVGGAKIWFKREEMAHTGAHKINNAVGQALLAKRVFSFIKFYLLTNFSFQLKRTITFLYFDFVGYLISVG